MLGRNLPNRESRSWIPLGQREHVRQFLEEKSDKHRTLFQLIPMVEDPQAAWLLLLMSTRMGFDFR